MVHALHNARRVLRKNGVLLDIRPTPDRRTIWWQSPQRRRIVGGLRGGRKRFRVAQRKIESIVQQGLLRLRHTEVFPLLHHAVSLRSLLAYVATEFPRSWVDDATVRRIRDLLGPKGAGHLIIEESARISILDKMGVG